MDVRPFTGIVRVTHSLEEVEQATRIGLEKKREGYSPEALVLAIDEVLHNLQLSRAIVVYVQSSSPEQADNEIEIERPFSWFSVLVSLGFATFCIWIVYILFQFVGPNTNIWGVIVLVIGQSILLRFSRRAVRLAVMSACDGLNNASYPTKLHPLRNATSAIGALRLRRLRELVAETTDRIVAGESPERLARELSELNLTPRAAKMVVRLARINASVRDYLPPYEARWLGITLALVFIVTCIVFIERAGDRLAEGYRNYAIGVSGWIAGDIAARPKRRRPRSPAS